MLMQEVPALLNLELVQGVAQLDVLDRLLGLPVELLCPRRLASVHCLVDLLEDAEVCAGRRACLQIGGFLPNPLPNQALVVLTLKVRAVGQVHRRSRDKSELLRNSCDSFRRLDFGDLHAQDRR